MSNVIYIWEWRRERARLGGQRWGRYVPPVQSPRPPRGHAHREKRGFVRIGETAAEIVKRLE